MLLPRLPVLSALLVLLLAAGRCATAGSISIGARGSGGRADGRVDGRGMLEPVGRQPRPRTEPELRAPVRASRSHQGPEGHPKDPRLKERFIKHLTGPLYFNPKCRKHFHRLYYNTRDCTIPAFYKRCARLLTRLANSPRCAER